MTRDDVDRYPSEARPSAPAYTPKPLDQSQADGGVVQADDRLTGKAAWDVLVNVDDRTSPEEYPDMCLITRDELIDFMSRATPAQSPPPADGVRGQDKCPDCKGDGGTFHGFTNACTREEWDKCERCNGDGRFHPRDDVREPADAGPVPATDRAGEVERLIADMLAAAEKMTVTTIVGSDERTRWYAVRDDLHHVRVLLADTQPATAQGKAQSNAGKPETEADDAGKSATTREVDATAADLLEQYARFIRDDVKADDLERHPYLPLIEQTIADLRATTPPPPAVSDDVRVMREVREHAFRAGYERVLAFARLGVPTKDFEHDVGAYLADFAGPQL